MERAIFLTMGSVLRYLESVGIESMSDRVKLYSATARNNEYIGGLHLMIDGAVVTNEEIEGTI